MDGTADAGAPRARQQNSAPGRLGPMTSALVLIGLALLLGTLSVLVMLPAAQHLRSFQDGERAPATLHTSGSCMLGRCQVTFGAGGRTVVADLPVGSGGGKSSVGTPMIVRYQADDPQVAVREDDVGGGGAAALAAVSGGAALFSLVLSVVALRRAAAARRPGARPDASGRVAA